MGVTPLARTLVSKKLVQIILVSLPETISKFQVDSSICSIDWGSETISPHEQDAHTAPERLQTRLCCLFLCRLPIEVCSHLLQEKISDPRALVLKADELFQSRVSSPVNLLAEQLDEPQVNAVATKT